MPRMRITCNFSVVFSLSMFLLYWRLLDGFEVSCAADERRFHQLTGGGADPLRLFHQTPWRSPNILPVRLRHVPRRGTGFSRLRRDDMRGYPDSATEDLDGVRRGSHIHLLPRQRVRHAVMGPVYFNVIVEIDAGCLPLPELETRRRQRLQRRTVQLGEQAGTTALALAERSLVQLRQQPGDRRVASPSEKNFCLRNAATIQRRTTWTPTSTLAFSLGRYGRAGMTATS